MRFWNSSALVALRVEEASSDARARAYPADWNAVVAWRHHLEWRHGLRAADAIQLARAIAASAPIGGELATLDRRLAQAAIVKGFRTASGLE